MFEVRQIETAPGLVFDVSVGGSDDGAPVLMLHGFCVSRHYYTAQVEALAAAGYRAIAPNQRGYAAGARPDPKDLDAYRMELLIRDALDIVEAAGHGAPRFHLVGHDWGGSLSWDIADRWPERVASLTMLSRPHPRAFLRALAMPDGEQAKRSSHHKWLLEPDAGPKVLADNAKWVRDRLTRNGVPPAQIEAHLSVLGNPAGMEAAIAWYRAAVSDTIRSRRPRCRRSTSGETTTIPSVVWRRKARLSSSPRPIVSSPWQGWGTIRRIRCRSRSVHCCLSTPESIRCSGRLLLSLAGQNTTPLRNHRHTKRARLGWTEMDVLDLGQNLTPVSRDSSTISNQVK